MTGRFSIELPENEATVLQDGPLRVILSPRIPSPASSRCWVVCVDSKAGLRVFLLNLGEKGFREPDEVGFTHLDLVADPELQHGRVRRELQSRDSGVRPPRELLDL